MWFGGQKVLDIANAPGSVAVMPTPRGGTPGGGTPRGSGSGPKVAKDAATREHRKWSSQHDAARAAGAMERMELQIRDHEQQLAIAREEQQRIERQQVVAVRAAQKREDAAKSAADTITASFDHLLAVGNSAREEMLSGDLCRHDTPR